MAVLPPDLYAIVDRAALSLAAWHVVEALAHRDGAALEPGSLIRATDLDVDTAAHAVRALEARGLVERDGSAARLVPAIATEVKDLVTRVQSDRELRRAVLKLATTREFSTGQLRLTIAWAPQAASEPLDSHSLASSALAVPAPTRPVDLEAPAA